MADLGANIENVNMNERDGIHSTLTFTMTVQNRLHLARIITRLRNIDMVERINRLHR